MSLRKINNVLKYKLNIKKTGCALNQTQLAHQWGISVRNLSRLFHQETGLIFSRWRQQAKILSSLQWIFAGLPANEVTCLSGYSNVSSYIEIFRERFGETPGQFKETGKSSVPPLTMGCVTNVVFTALAFKPRDQPSPSVFMTAT